VNAKSHVDDDDDDVRVSALVGGKFLTYSLAAMDRFTAVSLP